MFSDTNCSINCIDINGNTNGVRGGQGWGARVIGAYRQCNFQTAKKAINQRHSSSLFCNILVAW